MARRMAVADRCHSALVRVIHDSQGLSNQVAACTCCTSSIRPAAVTRRRLHARRSRVGGQRLGRVQTTSRTKPEREGGCGEKTGARLGGCDSMRVWHTRMEPPPTRTRRATVALGSGTRVAGPTQGPEVHQQLAIDPRQCLRSRRGREGSRGAGIDGVGLGGIARSGSRVSASAADRVCTAARVARCFPRVSPRRRRRPRCRQRARGPRTSAQAAVAAPSAAAIAETLRASRD
jgi:hypothetical protein